MTVADLLERFGPLPIGRIRTNPPPGAATEQDVIDIEAQESRLYELVDGILVEKTVGIYESYLAARLIHLLAGFVERHRLGIVVGADGMMRESAPRRQGDRGAEAGKTTSDTAQSGGRIIHEHPLGAFQEFWSFGPG
jgi:hypothetical protein